MLAQLEQLRTELADRAFELDRCGRADAADLAAEMVARIGELVCAIQANPAMRDNLRETCPECPGSFVG